MIKRSVVTIAVGNNYYYNLSKNLLKSFLRYNNPKNIQFQLLTDNKNEFKEFEKIIGVSIIELSNLTVDEKSFTSKFHLINHINANFNLFIDCDCLIYRSLDSVFEKFKGHDFSVIGKKENKGIFFGDIESIIQKFNLNYLPHFVGSIYYYTNSEISKNIFLTAKNLKSSYDEIKLVRLRGKENEEPLIAIAMALHQQEPLIEDGTIKADLMHFKKCNSNILDGKIKLVLISTKEQEEIDYNPVILHFNASYSDSWNYKIEEYRLQHEDNYTFLKILKGLITIKYLSLAKNYMKNFLRPTFRVFFGVRKIKKTKRTQHFE